MYGTVLSVYDPGNMLLQGHYSPMKCPVGIIYAGRKQIESNLVVAPYKRSPCGFRMILQAATLDLSYWSDGAGSYFDLTGIAPLNSSSALVAIVNNTYNASLVNHMVPQALGSSNIEASMGNMVVTVPVDVAQTTAISRVEVFGSPFTADGVSSQDPSYSLCNSTFRGRAGDQAFLTGKFHYSDHDGLACPFTAPMGAVPQGPGTVHDMAVILQGMRSSDTKAIDIGGAGRNLTLIDSSAAAVDVTAVVSASCAAAGASEVSDTLTMYANLEAGPYEIDVGHRCGSPVASIANGTQLPVQVGDTMCLPVSLNVPNGAAMLSFATSHTFNESVWQPTCVHTPGECGCPQTLPAFYNLAVGSIGASNYGDTNAVRYNSVWQKPNTSLGGVHVVYVVCFEVCAASDHASLRSCGLLTAPQDVLCEVLMSAQT
jgi:hypothetical protein